MTETELQTVLGDLIRGWENEVVEFKRGNDAFSTQDIGKYFSAISNEANLRSKDRDWLVFGVDDKTHSIVGTTYRDERSRLDALKHDIANGIEPSITFREIHELRAPEGRVILFEIPAAPRGIPISWRGHIILGTGKVWPRLGLINGTRSTQTATTDWTAQVVDEA
ncbi:MAG: ATP-binding protein [Pyrinomonadaceae bacterium]